MYKAPGSPFAAEKQTTQQALEAQAKKFKVEETPLAFFTTPAAWTVPIAFAVAIVVSLRDRNKVADIGHKFALMHVPEIDDRVDEVDATGVPV